MTAPDPLASMSPDDLIAVIERGLDADERAARESAREMGDAPMWWVERDDTVAVPMHDPYSGTTKGVFTVASTGPDVGRPVTEHIARHDPSRVLAEVESKREILARCEHELRSYFGTGGQAATPYLVLRALARPYLTQETQ